MNRIEYEKSICQRLHRAELVDFHRVTFADGTAPKVAHCHDNVNRWVKENPGATAVRGWVTVADSGLSIGLAPHSVVRTEDGQMFDITPLENEYYRQSMRFIPHEGNDGEFFSMTESNVLMECQYP